VLAARQLGIAEIPVMVAAGWTEAQKRAYVLADNQLAITGSGWDPELLRLELGELNLAGFDLSLTGFGDLELKDGANTSPPSRVRACARETAREIKDRGPADKVERWPIERLIPYAKNARTHSDAQIAAIAASVKEWGWTTPVLVSEDGGLIAGHARVLAARQLGIAEIPVIGPTRMLRSPR
jgi:ParB-like chromosome segregation protein Spo0J